MIRKQSRALASFSERLEMVERKVSEMTAPVSRSYYRFLIRKGLVWDRRIPLLAKS